jgi:hypothetical protein
MPLLDTSSHILDRAVPHRIANSAWVKLPGIQDTLVGRF